MPKNTKKKKKNTPMKIRVKVFILILNFIEPMLFVDVNLGNSGNKRIVVYEGDTAEGCAEKFAQENNLDEVMKEKLTQMLQ